MSILTSPALKTAIAWVSKRRSASRRALVGLLTTVASLGLLLVGVAPAQAGNPHTLTIHNNVASYHSFRTYLGANCTGTVHAWPAGSEGSATTYSVRVDYGFQLAYNNVNGGAYHHYTARCFNINGDASQMNIQTDNT